MAETKQLLYTRQHTILFVSHFGKKSLTGVKQRTKNVPNPRKSPRPPRALRLLTGTLVALHEQRRKGLLALQTDLRLGHLGGALEVVRAGLGVPVGRGAALVRQPRPQPVFLRARSLHVV